MNLSNIDCIFVETLKLKIMKKSNQIIKIDAVLTIVFIILKLLDVIHWSWFMVFSPLWITVIINVLILIFKKKI